MPNDNKQNQNTTTPVVPAEDLPPVLSMEDNVPPTLQNEPAKPLQVEGIKDSGSAAPSNDVVMPPVITTQKKKFAGGKVIATILGLFLLVGGLGAGIYLVDQNQNINEKAGLNNCDICLRNASYDECSSLCQGNNAPTGQIPPSQPDDDGDDGNDQDLNGNPVAGIPGVPSDPIVGKSCDGPSDCGTGYACVGASLATSKCVLNSAVTIPSGVTLCNAETPGVPESIGVCCVPGETTSYDYETGQPFPGAHWTTCTSGYTCQQNQGCFSSGGGTPPPGGGSVSASCQNVKAYSPTWTLLTNAQLSALRTGSQVNFCVTGAATGGSFNKARFTINSVLQAETTTVRPGSTDFCQTYTIPAATTAFAVTAQINHNTLGWK